LAATREATPRQIAPGWQGPGRNLQKVGKQLNLSIAAFDWHHTAPEAVKSEMYERLWEDTGKPSMQLPREQHLLVQKGCPQAVNAFFSAYYDRMASGA
jgi:hypothetical protein